MAEARYLRAQHGPGLQIAYAGTCPPVNSSDLDAAITFGDLEQLFQIRGVSVLSQPTLFQRVPEERRRHLSAAGGLPLALLEEARHSSRRFRKIRGLDALKAVARAVSVDRLDLGFVDILSNEGALDHPLSGPQDQLYWRRELLRSVEAPRSRNSVLDGAVVASIGATFEIKQRRVQADPDVVDGILAAIGKGPNGRPWDCRACGFETCQRFAEAASLGRASMRQCGPYQERRAEEAQRAAAVDTMTGLSTYRVLRDRLAFEVERGKRSNEGFAVLFLDLDRFKDVNDQYGHEAGNDILRAVAGEIRNAVRASDVAARYGGDEFVVILTRTDLQGGARVAEALRAGIEGVGLRLGYPPGLVTVSIGLAEFDPLRAVGWRSARRGRPGAVPRQGGRQERRRLSSLKAVVKDAYRDRIRLRQPNTPCRHAGRPTPPEGVPDPWGVRRAENLLTSLEGILSARVVTTPLGEVSEVHILAQAGLAPKQLVRNIESALLAQLGLKVDHRKDQHCPDGRGPAHRGVGA